MKGTTCQPSLSGAGLIHVTCLVAQPLLAAASRLVGTLLGSRNPDGVTATEQLTHTVACALTYSSEGHYIRETSMDKAISAADANRRFSQLLRTVNKGRSVVVTSHGRPVAIIAPVMEEERAAEGARSALFARLKRQRAVKIGGWTRDELYDDAL